MTSASSSSSRAAEARARLAALEVRRSFLKAEVDIELQRRQLELEREAAVALAELHAYELYDIGKAAPPPPVIQPINHNHYPMSAPVAPVNNAHVPIGLLIGSNCPKAMQPLDCIPAMVDDSPCGIKTPLGWCIAGPVCSRDSDKMTTLLCNFVKPEMSISVKDHGLSDMFKLMYEAEFVESGLNCQSCCNSNLGSFEKGMSQNDRRFITMMNASVVRDNSHYCLPLPFDNPNVCLPSNREQVLKRLQGLKRRIDGDSKYQSDYVSFINGMLSNGYAKKSMRADEGLWYIPHHGVYHPHKPDKLRVVFDCSYQCKGISLNKVLLSGPDLTNSLVGVLLRFRQERIAVMADIEAMFYQVSVPENHQNYLRFLWWPDGDTSLTPVDHQMTVHLFGATSSPSCANFALRQTAKEFEAKYGLEIAETLRRNFYVDDMLKSVPDEAMAIEVISSVKDMCAEGGFKLTKFTSNSKAVVNSIPVLDRSKEIQSVDLSKMALPMERALGVNWCIENDVFNFRIVLKDKPLTRRGILSSLSSIYDPLGFVAPFLIKGKKLLQSLCCANIGWDDELDDEARIVWERWRLQLPLLESLTVNRCYKPVDFGPIESVSIHSFSDASSYAYGQCSYLRLVDTNDRISCCLLMGKSRVAPSKPVTIPRLELVAATMSVKISNMLVKELEFGNIQCFHWTDSNAVLGYVSNTSKRYHVFVANRVQLIRENSELASWHYVCSKLNPADDASRGLNFDEITDQHRWFKGPDFLWNCTVEFPMASSMNTIPDSDPEVKQNVKSLVTQTAHLGGDAVDRLIAYCDSWFKLKRLVAWILLCMNNLLCRSRGTKPRDLCLGLSTANLKDAEVSVIRYVQRHAFPEELKSVSLSKPIKLSSALFNLTPALNSTGLLVIGGRLQKSALNECSKHQAILPKNSPVSRLIVKFFHGQSLHSGSEYVLSLIRERYWIIGSRRLVKDVRRNCFTCRKLFNQPLTQQMSSLPKDRVAVDVSPFTYVGIDYFGPFLVKVNRSEVKRYGCIFTCLTMRAVHIELAHSLDTDSFINCLQRFMCRRGMPVEFRSDNGTNFVGAEAELKRAIQEWNKSTLESFLLQKEISWKFNTPTASHMGGTWERMIRSVRKLLLVLVSDQKMTEENLSTMLCLAENMLNNRPLTPVSNDPQDLEALTPNHLLLFRKTSGLPPGQFVKQDLYVRRRWRQIQFLADLFWQRWKREYLPMLQSRAKWIERKSNLQVNDFVLLMDDNLPRNCWLYGRVIEVFPGTDGLVRSVTIKTKNGLFDRPIHKLCLLEANDDDMN
ncbi:MAG: hypothetical protein R2813_00025 [Flavobacteriales bacterium]